MFGGGLGNPEHYVGHKHLGGKSPITFAGTIGRLGFLVWVVAGVLVAIATGFFANALDSAGAGEAGDALYFLGSIISILMIVSATVRRLHDLDKSGWLWLLLPIPLVNILLLLYLLLKPGQNWQYTPEPESADTASPPYRPYEPQ